jgi:tagaturonate reductase
MDLFASSVFERYANPFIHHLLLSIALNSVSKYKQRILPTLLQTEKQGTFPAHALFSLAALIVFYRGIDPRGGQIPLKEEQKFLDLFQKLWCGDNIASVTKAFLSLDYWETDYLNQEQVVQYVTEWATIMVNQGMSYALDCFLSR